MRVIPAIDIIEGKCVRLSKGDYTTKKVYSEDPLEMAKKFQDNGIKYLHLVDLDGARAGRVINYKVLEKLASNTHLAIDFGGGLRTDQDLQIAFDSGARQITGGSITLKDPQLFKRWIAVYGVERIILGADAKNEKVAIAGWQEESREDLLSFIRSYQNEGINTAICTDISRDGMLQGPAIRLYQKLIKNLPANFNLIASGGISAFEELAQLADAGCEGVIIGKAIYENKIGLKQLESYILENTKSN